MSIKGKPESFHTYSIDNIKIKQNPVNCRDSLVDAGFQNQLIKFNQNGGKIILAQDYKDVFKHNRQDECELIKCQLMTSGNCGKTLV